MASLESSSSSFLCGNKGISKAVEQRGPIFSLNLSFLSGSLKKERLSLTSFRFTWVPFIFGGRIFLIFYPVTLKSLNKNLQKEPFGFLLARIKRISLLKLQKSSSFLNVYMHTYSTCMYMDSAVERQTKQTQKRS